MKKITFEINFDKENELAFIKNTFDNVIFFKKKKKWILEIIINNKTESILVTSFLKNRKYVFSLENVESKNWLADNVIKDKLIFTNFFTFSQGLNKKLKQQKNHFIIPAGQAFGTGSHPSTILIIHNIEFLLKKKKISKSFDLGSGTGILSFVLRKLLKKKVYSSDYDKNAENILKKNCKLNQLNEIAFVRCRDLKSRIFKKNKFELVVSNLLLNSFKDLGKDLSLIIYLGGFLIISGIVETQKNSMISYFRSFNFKLVRFINLRGWVSIIFKKV